MNSFYLSKLFLNTKFLSKLLFQVIPALFIFLSSCCCFFLCSSIPSKELDSFMEILPAASTDFLSSKTSLFDKFSDLILLDVFSIEIL